MRWNDTGPAQSKIGFIAKTNGGDVATAAQARRKRAKEAAAKLEALTGDDPSLKARLSRLGRFARSVRVSEYHLTNACNIRCAGCWFFEYGHDTETHEVTDSAALEAFVIRERQDRKINSALIIGGEPTLFPDRIRIFCKHMKYVTVSSNGLKRLPVEGFENVSIGLTLFGGGKLDDELRAIKPSGRRFSGLFDSVLENYRGDDRAFFVYAVTEDGIEYIEDTVRRIRDNGNPVTFNFYSKYGSSSPSAVSRQRELLNEALRVKALFPDTVISHPYYINAIITGQSHWGAFGYENCPSISVDHLAHRARMSNGNPHLPVFNAWSADLKTVKFCCTSGHCDGCRDSQAVFSWLLVNMHEFLTDKSTLQTWLDVAESYWSQFYWSPFHRSATDAGDVLPSAVSGCAPAEAIASGVSGD
ncbi:MAG: radical SAM protein [Sulfurifustis sp.]